MHSMKSKCFQPQCMSLPFTFLDRGLENECRFSLCARVFYRVMPYITVHATLILRKVLSASRLRSVRAGTVSNASVTSSTRRRAGCRVGVRGCSRWGLGGGCWRWWKNASARVLVLSRCLCGWLGNPGRPRAVAEHSTEQKCLYQLPSAETWGKLRNLCEPHLFPVIIIATTSEGCCED